MIVVTGGAGFIGSNVVSHLNSLGESDILVCDRLDNSVKWRNLDRIRFADYVDKDDLFDYLGNAGVQAFIHMGARTDTMELDSRLIVEDNYQYSKVVWKWCHNTGTKLVYASSASVYGNGALGFSEDVNLDQSHALNPYAYSKLLFDRWVLRQNDVPSHWRGVRFFNVYGYGEAHKGKMASVILQAARDLLGAGRVRLFKSYRDDYPDGGQRRDFIHVDDAAEIVCSLAANDHVSNGFYNVGTGQARSFRDLAESVARALGRELRIEYVDMPEGLEPRYQYFTQADMTKLSSEGVRFAPVSLEDGVSEYLSRLREDGID